MFGLLPVLTMVLFVFLPAPSLPQHFDFSSRFGRFDGCLALRELNGGGTLRHNESRCSEPFTPCSTFKIFNALAGLDCGAVSGPDMMLKWNGKPQRVKAWEKDHSLATAIRDSVLWYFQEVAGRIGEERMKKYLVDNHYGNQDSSGGIRQFWLESSLRISANEQAEFLERLYTGRTSFSAHAVENVKKLLIQQEGKGWTFSGKTGSGHTPDGRTLGWFVGHMRSGGKEFVLALNISAKEGASGAVAKDLVKLILADLGLIHRG